MQVSIVCRSRVLIEGVTLAATKCWDYLTVRLHQVHVARSTENQVDGQQQFNVSNRNNLDISFACAKVKKRRTAKVLLIKAKSYETLVKGRLLRFYIRVVRLKGPITKPVGN